MKSYKQFIDEKYVTTNTSYAPRFDNRRGFEIFVNPSPGEKRELFAQVKERNETVLKFVFDYKKGKSYFVKPMEADTAFIHIDIINILAVEGLVEPIDPMRHFKSPGVVKQSGYAALVLFPNGEIAWAESYQFTPSSSMPEEVTYAIIDKFDKEPSDKRY